MVVNFKVYSLDFRLYLLYLLLKLFKWNWQAIIKISKNKHANYHKSFTKWVNSLFSLDIGPFHLIHAPPIEGSLHNPLRI